MVSIEQCKEDIASKYLEQFKSELNFFEKAMILPISGKMKDILKSNKKIDAENFSDLEDLWFRRKVMWVKFWNKEIFEWLVNKTFKFLKENQERILEAQTQWKLEDLLANVINWKLNVLNQNVNQSWESTQNESQQSQPWEDTSQQSGLWTSEQSETTQSGSQQSQAWEQSTQESESNNTEQNETQQGDNAEQAPQQNQEWEGTDQQTEWNQEWGWLNDHAVEVWAWTALVWWFWYKKWIAEAERRLGLAPKEIPTEFDAAKSKKMLEGLAKQMEEMKEHNPKLNKVQKYTYQKSIDNFKKAAASLDWKTELAFKDWQKIWGKLSPDFLKHVNIDHSVLNMIDKLPDEELGKIVGKSEKEIVKILEKKWIKISEEFAKSLKLAWNVQEIKQLTNIARNGRNLSNFLRWVKWMWVITFLFMWFDAWLYLDSSKEADLVKKINEIRWEIKQDEATQQLIIWLWWVLLEALALVWVCAAWGSVGWPIWTAVGIAVWVIIWAASFATSWYYAKKDFYAQNRYDFINKKRAEVKQSIVQLFESNRLGMHESMKQSIKDARWPNSEVNTMEDAWEALIHQEEVKDGDYQYLSRYYNSWEKEEDFLKKLDQEDKERYKEEKEKMEKIINIRMEYIKKHISTDNGSQEHQALQEKIKNSWWLVCVEQILADSKVYEYLKSEDSEPYVDNYKSLDVAWYKEAYKNKLSAEYPDEFKIFEQLRNDNPILLDEICRGTALSKTTIMSYIESSERWTPWEDADWNSTEGDNKWEEKIYTEDEIKSLKKNIDFIEKYVKYKELGVAQENKIELWLTDISLDYNYIEQVLIDFKSISKRPNRDKKTSLNYIITQEFMDRNEWRRNEVSWSLFQNILYDIAKNIHGYQWKNNKEELVSFYASSWDVTWIYMNWKWKINEDREIDSTIDNPDHMSKEDMLKTIVWEVELDSAVEAADEKITQEVREEIKDIINKEFSYREQKEQYEKKLTEYIKSQGWQWYIEIPNDLSYECRKAGIGEIYNFLFTYENWTIKALWRWDLINKTLNFDKTNTQISYEAMNKLRENFTPEEKSLIDEVDNMEKRLLNIRKVEWSAVSWTKEDELDIPVELERIMSKKSWEWSDIKDSILYLEPYNSRDYLAKVAKEYHDYFEWMYIGILNEITKKNKFLNSNDVDEIEEFLQASSFTWSNIIKVEKWTISVSDNVDKKVWEYLIKLLDEYKDSASWKTVKQLLTSDDEKLQNRGQELARKLYTLCLEETVIKKDSEWNISDFVMWDMDDDDFEKVRNKMSSEISTNSFNEMVNKFKDSELAKVNEATTREVEAWETKVHEKVNDITNNIIDTMNHIDWAWMRKNPKFEPDEKQPNKWEITWKFKSRGYEEKITITSEGENIKNVKIDGLNIWFNNPEEWIRTANLINFIKDNAKKNPYWNSAKGRIMGSYGYYHWSNWWDLERDVTNNMNDFNILDVDTVDKSYPTIKDNETFISYINKFVK